MLIERNNAGLARTVLNRTILGRKSALTPSTKRRLLDLKRNSSSLRTIANEVGINRGCSSETSQGRLTDTRRVRKIPPITLCKTTIHFLDKTRNEINRFYVTPLSSPLKKLPTNPPFTLKEKKYNLGENKTYRK